MTEGSHVSIAGQKNRGKQDKKQEDFHMGAGEKRLEAFEKMLAAVQNEYEEIQIKLEGMKTAGRTKSATYRQLMGRKMTLQSMLTIYEVYGLTGEKKQMK